MKYQCVCLRHLQGNKNTLKYHYFNCEVELERERKPYPDPSEGVIQTQHEVCHPLLTS